MKSFQAYLHLLIFLSLAATSTARYAKTGCNDTCGNNVSIPYPFGIGAGCSVNEWYIVECNSSTPYLSSLNRLEILSVNVENLIVTVRMQKSFVCLDSNKNLSRINNWSVDLNRSPFLFSKLHNNFVFDGCGYSAMRNNVSSIPGCVTSCNNATLNDTLSDQNCVGFRCCQAAIPSHLKSYAVTFTLDVDGVDGAFCWYSFLMDKTSIDQRRLSDPFVPVSLVWTLAASDQVTCCDNRTRYMRKVDVFDSTPVDTWQCDGRWSSKGTPYLVDGCDEQEEPTAECRECEKGGGVCDQNTTYYIDGSVFNQKVACYYNGEKRKPNKTSLGVILGVSISMGILFLVAMSYILYKVIKKTKERRRKKRFFKRNGGLLLKQQEETDPSLVEKTILFTSRELDKATDNFNENRILGRGGQGTVYKGMLVDGRIVAVKKSKIVDESQLEQFINEVVILSQVNHRNVVKLLGCCLETDVPLLVSEFIPNGTLYDMLHNTTDEFPITLNMRLQIATEVAGALAYLHSATSIPIYHRDIKTTNILLDDKYRAKVSDFGTSKCASIDQTHLTTLVKGTFGYLDPEYFQSSQFTDKSDVYSFGVVLVELLTREKPISLTRFGENRSLASYFMLAMEERRFMSIVDSVVIKDGTSDELLMVANLAMRCLNFSGKYRPTMKEVAVELETIRASHIPNRIQTNIRYVRREEELSMSTYGESSTTFLSFNDSITK